MHSVNGPLCFLVSLLNYMATLSGLLSAHGLPADSNPGSICPFGLNKWEDITKQINHMSLK